MSETHATIGSRPPGFPPGRYGRRRERRRRPVLTALLALGVVVAGTLAAARLYRFYGDPTYDAQVVRYTGITDTQVVVDFVVNVPPGGAARCVLRARSYDGAEVGRTEVSVRAEPGRQRVGASHPVATRARPHIGEVVRCRAADQR